MTTIRLWDLPLRLFHWLLVIATCHDQGWWRLDGLARAVRACGRWVAYLLIP